MSSFRPPVDVGDALKQLNLAKNAEAERKAAARRPVEDAPEEVLDFDFLYKSNQGSRFEYVETSLKAPNRPNALKGLNASLGQSPSDTVMPRRGNVSQEVAHAFHDMDAAAAALDPASYPPPPPPPPPPPLPPGSSSSSSASPAAPTEPSPEEKRAAMKRQVEELSQRCHVARNLREQEALPEAEAEFRVCLRMLIALLGPTHMETIRCMQNLAECLFAQGELQLAEGIL
jgi:hypothetical protein